MACSESGSTGFVSDYSDDMSTNNTVDKLKNIRPFTESQLLSLHQISELENYDAFVDIFLQVIKSRLFLKRIDSIMVFIFNRSVYLSKELVSIK